MAIGDGETSAICEGPAAIVNVQQVWEYQPDVNSRTVDVHIAWLRQKIEDNPQFPKHILTVRGSGYRFSP